MMPLERVGWVCHKALGASGLGVPQSPWNEWAGCPMKLLERVGWVCHEAFESVGWVSHEALEKSGLGVS